jgi:hypothetical protein
MAAYPREYFLTSIVTFHEQFGGWQSFLNRRRDGSSVVRAYAEFERLLAAYTQSQIACFNAPAESQVEQLRRRRVRIGTMD